MRSGCSRPWTRRTAPCGFPVCRRGFRERPAASRARPRSWVPTPTKCSTNSDWRGSTVDFDMGQDAAALRRTLRDLVKTHVPEHFLGAFTDNPEDLAVAQRFCRTLAEQGLLCMSWPKEFGGSGSS